MKVKEIISKINLPARASMAYLGASIIGKAIGILTTPFFTRLISEEEYGALTLYMTLLGGASVICSAVSSGSAVYRGFSEFEENSGGFVKSALAVSFTFSASLSVILFSLLPFSDLNRSFYLPLALQILSDAVVGVAMARARFRYKYLEVMTVSIFSSALPAIASLLILKNLGCGCGVRIYTLLIISLAVAIIETIRIINLPGQADREMIIFMTKTSLPLLPHSISVALSGQADKLFITSIMGAAALAKYSVVHSLGIALQFAVTALGSALGPWIIRRINRGEKERIGQVTMTLFSLLIAFSLGLCGIAPEAMSLLAPDKYSEALPALIPIALSVPLSFLSYVITVGLVQSEKGRYTAVISIINLALCIFFNYTLIPYLDYLGAGIALLLSQLGSVICGIAFIRISKIKEAIPFGRVLPTFFFSLSVGLGCYLLYDNTEWRAVLMIIPGIWGIKSLFECLKLMKEKS